MKRTDTRTGGGPVFTHRRKHTLFAMCLLLLVLMVIGGLVAPIVPHEAIPAPVFATP